MARIVGLILLCVMLSGCGTLPTMPVLMVNFGTVTTTATAAPELLGTHTNTQAEQKSPAKADEPKTVKELLK